MSGQDLEVVIPPSNSLRSDLRRGPICAPPLTTVDLDRCPRLATAFVLLLVTPSPVPPAIAKIVSDKSGSESERGRVTRPLLFVFALFRRRSGRVFCSAEFKPPAPPAIARIVSDISGSESARGL